jgi:hypothetical protein
MFILDGNYRMPQRECSYLYDCIIRNKVKTIEDLDRLPKEVKGFICQRLKNLVTFNNTVGHCWKISLDPKSKGVFGIQWITAQIRQAINQTHK